MTTTQSEADSDFLGYLRILSRRRRTVFLATALGVSLMAGYAFLSAPIYQASALVSVEKVGSDIASPTGEKQDSDDSYFDTQFKLITSETQLRRVYQELNLRDVAEFHEGLKPLREAVSAVPVPHTRLASVNAESRDPRLAALISGSLARAFVRKNLDNQLFMSKNVLGALQSRTHDPDARLLIESLPAVVNNKLIQDIKTQIFNNEAALAELRTRYTVNYPAVQALQSRLDSMRKVRDHEMDNILGSLKTELSGQLRANNVRIVDEPAIPAAPVRPRKGLALIIGFAGGLVLGVLAALALETFDQTIQTHEDVEKMLGLPFLGMIPYARREKGARVYAPLISADITPSSEAFRNLRTIVGLANKAANDPLLLVTSTVQAEGKSFVATNLAVALSQLGQKVLIIDGDLRRPNQHLNLSSTAKLGLADFLAGGVPDAGHVAQKTVIPNLELVTCGTRSKNPAELLNAEQLAKFVAWARGRYTRVIVDCPPVFPVSDVLLWGRHVNSTLFVAHYGRTRVPLIQTACARLRVGGVRIVGGVINGAKIGTTRYADGCYSDLY
jgi:capsular exopolysaccharide synthesis family protein